MPKRTQKLQLETTLSSRWMATRLIGSDLDHTKVAFKRFYEPAF
jgi:hypothetical protein